MSQVNPPVLVERAHRDARTARQRDAVQALRQQRVRLTNPRRIQRNPTATPASLPEPRLSLLPATPHRSGRRRTRNPEQRRYILLPDAAQQM